MAFSPPMSYELIVKAKPIPDKSILKNDFVEIPGSWRGQISSSSTFMYVVVLQINTIYKKIKGTT